MPTETFFRRTAALHQAAEAQARVMDQRDPALLSPAEVARLLHELRVHQIELEMQNEELIRTQVELEKSRARYFDLYQMAPVGYLTLSEKGLILEANLRAANLLGMPGSTLVSRPLSRFLLPPDSDIYYRCHRLLFRTGQPQACEVRLAPRRAGAAVTWVRLEMALTQDEKEQATVGSVICRDITERKRATEALREREEQQRFILDHLPVGVVLADISGTASYMNPRFTELFGYTLAQVPRLADWWLLAHPEPTYREQIVAEWNRRLAEALASAGETRPLDVVITCADGAVKNVNVTARVIGELLFVTFIDLTGWQAAEEALRASESRYRDLYDNAPVAYFSVGTDGRIRHCNRQAAQMLGATIEQTVGRPVFDLYPDNPHGKAKARQVFQHFLAGEPVVNEELQMLRADGTPLWINLSVTAMRDAAGRVLESRSAVLDITERKRAEEALAVSEERYRLLTMLSPDGISVTDQTGRILACNEQFAAMYGFGDSAEVVGRNAQELASPEAFAGLFRAAAAALEKGESVVREIEVEVLRRDGSPFFTEYSIAPVPWPDAPSGVAYLSSIRDITRRKKQAAELEQYRLHLEELVSARTAELRTQIAERTAAQTALERNTASLKAAERVARMGSWERDLITGELTISDGLYRLLGLSPEMDPQAAFVAAWDAVHPEDAAATKAVFAHATAVGESLNVTFRIGLPVGQARVLRVLAETMCDVEGKPVCLRATAQDVTEREQIRAALDRRIQELLMMQELGRVVSLKLPLEEVIRIYLENIVAFAGLDMAQVFLLREGHLHLAGVHTVLPAAAAQARVLDVGECLCGLAVQEGRPVYAGDVERDPRCTQAHCHVNGLHSLAALPLHDGETVIGALALGAVAPDAFADRLALLETIADLLSVRLLNVLLHQEIQIRAAGLEETVIERTHELQAERDRTQIILESVGESVIVTDLAGQVLFANPATQILTGFSRDESLGMPLWRHWSAQEIRTAWPRAQQALRSGQPWRGEITGLRKDGALYTVALTGMPLYDERAGVVPTGGVWVQRNITTVKEAERIKDQFVSNVSHELRTPTSVIMLSCDNLDAFYDRLSDGQRRQMLQDIREQARLLGNLVEDILMLSQIDNSRVSQVRSRVDLARLAREEVARQQPLAVGRSQGLSVAADAPVVVLGHEMQLRRMMRNLLDNAIKYSPAGARVSCTCEIRGVAPDAPCLPSELWAVFEVTDEGMGIPADAVPLLFERFYRVNVEDEIQGTGLGLPIVRELVVMHGGWIDVASTPGQGSTFTVYLPLEGQAAGGKSQEPEA